MPKRPAAHQPRVRDAEVPTVGMREPCPCGSGKRYKACHGKLVHRAKAATAPRRPFAGLAAEVGLVAMREIVSAGTARLRLRDPYADRAAFIATLLPYGTATMTAPDGEVWIGAQTASPGSEDPSRDLAYALSVGLSKNHDTPAPEFDGRLQDLLDPDLPLGVEIHDSFEFWRTVDPLVESGAVERASEAVIPAVQLPNADAAYWCRLVDREQVRWVLPYEEDVLLDALARLRAADADGLGAGTRLLGTFRAYGLLIPVWDLPPGTSPEAVREPAADFVNALTNVLETHEPLTGAERRARAGLSSRQVTIR
jgi:Family of unknown function (DUF5926)/SEC-C motif